MITLDELDHKVIRLLQENPRMSSRAMVKRLGEVSDRVVRYRIKRLLDHQVLLLQANVNPQAVGYPVIADILIETMPWKLSETCDKLAAMPPVAYVSAAHRGRQLSIQVNARSERELMTFVRGTLPQIDGIVDARAMVVPHLVKDVAVWEIPR
jgi:Lrp/AsnC family transcriptional regulator, regulator for asnA, asnC and gidA